MTTQTMTSIVEVLSIFDEVWILQEMGANNQLDRRNAITQARQNVLSMPTKDFHWLLAHLKNAIAPELSNDQPYEKRLRLRLTAFAIIHYIRNAWDHIPLLRTLDVIGNKELREIYGQETIE